MAICSGILNWKVPWTEESGRLQSMGSQRAEDDLATKNSNSGSLGNTQWREKCF